MGKRTVRADINEECCKVRFNKRFNEIKDLELPKLRKKDEKWYWLEDKRFYISEKKYYIVEGTYYENRRGETVKYDDYIAVELIELSSKSVFYLDVSMLLKEGYGYKTRDVDKDNESHIFKSYGIINEYMISKVCDFKPYITNKELVDVFINYVGKRHIYFDKTSYYIPNGSLRVERKILNAHFVKDLSVY